jgi:tetratricopeptide (TPR) repeat protein
VSDIHPLIHLRPVTSVVSLWSPILRIAGVILMAGCAAFLQAKDDPSGIIAVASADIRTNPNDAAAYLRRGNAEADAGDFDRAIADINEVIRLKPNDAASYTNRGDVRVLKGDLDGGIADYDEAVRRDPNAADAYMNRGAVKFTKGDLDGAIADENKAIQLNPKLANAYDNRGGAKQAKGDFDGAIADEDEAIRRNPSLILAYSERGAAKQAKGDLDAAIADFNESIRRDPNSANAYNGFAWWRAVSPNGKFRNGPQAVEYARKACELSGWKEEAYIDTLAAAYAEVGNFSEAVKWQTECLKFTLPKEEADQCRQRLTLYEQKKPYRGESTHK